MNPNELLFSWVHPEELVDLAGTSTIYYTPTVGQAGGGSDAHPFADDNVLAENVVTSIQVRHGKLVDAVQLVFKDHAGHIVTSPQHGGIGGRLSVFNIDADQGEYITGIFGGAGKALDSIGFKTNTGRQSNGGTPFGGGGGGHYRIEIPEGYEIVGFIGAWGHYDGEDRPVIGRIGVAYRKRGS